MNGVELRVKGKVQGVGFRPFVWQLAHRLSLHGDVLNDGEGVRIRLLQNGNTGAFQERLLVELPPLAQIDAIHTRNFKWRSIPEQFSIVESNPTAIDTQVVPDAATCPECLEELLSNRNRRYHYPFNNCTHCGPRFTIIKQLPYDRSKTVMADFPICAACQSEYKDPADRRYHAQPIACPECGPLAQAILPNGEQCEGDWFAHAIQALKSGKIIAIKSVGGFHLACDASNALAVQKLRDKKQRQNKPFAIMVSKPALVEEIAYLSKAEKKALKSSAAPIVLLKKRIELENIAPHLNEVGVMLPSNPVQHLISHYFHGPVVMTSGNGSGLPPALNNQQAIEQLGHIADLFVLHNRDIVQRCDDSLIRINSAGQQETLRRSRGMVPDAITLPDGFPNADGFVAYGGDLKNAFAIGKNNQVIVSQYLGDLANIETQEQYISAMEHYCALYDIKATQHVADLHSGYFSHQYALAQTGDHHLIQHHHAHIASCLVENGWGAQAGKVLALALDGLGLGDDGTLWGAELFVTDYQNYQRIGGIPDIDLVGGDKAAKEPWRALYAHLRRFYPDINDDAMPAPLTEKPLSLLDRAFESGLNCHKTRSAGRLFDAVAASLGIAFDDSEYEGMAACQLEALAHQCNVKQEINPIDIGHNGLELNLEDFWPQFIHYKEHEKGSLKHTQEKAYLFHLSLASALATIVIEASKQHQTIKHLVITGGVFHNTLLTELLKKSLADRLSILQHTRFSCGDGGLALGQMAIALMKSDSSVSKKKR
jgi:hydrogenase maturation protein HypF